MNKMRKLFLFIMVYFNLFGLTYAYVTPEKTTKSGRNNRLPDYYDTYIVYIAGKINQIVKKSSPEADGFFFITDTHVGSNALNGGEILRILQEETQVKKVICGGDAITAFGTKEELE